MMFTDGFSFFSRTRCAMLVALAMLATLAVPNAGATMLTETSAEEVAKLFTTEIKRDKAANGANLGKDVFLRNQDDFVGPSADVNWGPSGTSYDWSLSYDGDNAMLGVQFAGAPLNLNVTPDGLLNAVKVITRSTDSNRHASATVTVVIDEVNGSPLAVPRVETASLVQFNEVTLGLDSGDPFTSLSGTLTWDFEFAPGANGSPNSNFAFIIKGLTVVPEPSSAILALGAIAAMATNRRRAG